MKEMLKGTGSKNLSNQRMKSKINRETNKIKVKKTPKNTRRLTKEELSLRCEALKGTQIIATYTGRQDGIDFSKPVTIIDYKIEDLNDLKDQVFVTIEQNNTIPNWWYPLVHFKPYKE
jgi:hypothetical protein